MPTNLLSAMIKLEYNKEKCPKKFIKRVCKLYAAEFLGRFLYKPDVEKSVLFFYCSNPRNSGYSRYFAIYEQDNKVYIADGSHFDGRKITALKVDGKYYYSSDRHDFISVGDRFIDGGEVYIRTNSPENIVQLEMKDGKWHERKTES